MLRTIVAVMLLSISGAACADEWTDADTRREAVYMVFHVADWAQTRNIARNPDRWHETNVILGKHPGVNKVDAYFVSTALLHYAVAAALPVEYRSAFQYVSIGFEAGVVGRNLELGIGVKF